MPPSPLPVPLGLEMDEQELLTGARDNAPEHNNAGP